MGPQDCGGRRCCNSYEGIARITSLFYIFDEKTERNYPGGEGSRDRHSGTQGRPEGGGRVGGGARGADHHDDPPPGLSPDELMTKERLNDHL